MFEPTIGYYDTIQTENTARMQRIIERLHKTERVHCILSEDTITVICQMEYDASDLARSMIMAGCSFVYQYQKFTGV